MNNVPYIYIYIYIVRVCVCVCVCVCVSHILELIFATVQQNIPTNTSSNTFISRYAIKCFLSVAINKSEKFVQNINPSFAITVYILH